jgi:2-amino-4-hydroxy-6-hydroxymethyldihydropteridine diphosphokinase
MESIDIKQHCLRLDTLASRKLGTGRNLIFLWKECGKNRNIRCVHKIVYLSLGSNLGDREVNLRTAVAKLSAIGNPIAVSSFYDTEPVEVASQPWFLNCVVKLDTEKMPRQLISAILALEQEMGRQRKQQKGPRTIDIDILLFGSSVIEIPSLTIPHPKLHQRRFVLEPLAEIAPEARHPVFKRTIRELRDALPAGQMVRKVVNG